MTFFILHHFLPVVSPRCVSPFPAPVSPLDHPVVQAICPEPALHNKEQEMGKHNGRTTTGKMMQNEKCHFYIFNIFLNIDFYQQIMSTISFKTFSGSFSRYWNKNLVFFCKIFFVRRCSKMKFLPITHEYP